MPNKYLRDELRSRAGDDESFFERLCDVVLDGIWVWDLENPEHAWMSPGFWRMCGYQARADSDHADAWQALIHPEDLVDAKRRLEEHFADQSKPYRHLLRYRHKRGRWVWAQCVGAALADDSGQLTRMFGGHIDVSSLVDQREAVTERTQRIEALEMHLKIETQRRQRLEKMIERMQAGGGHA